MLEELFNLVKENASETVINNPDVPNDQNDDVIAEATNTVASGLRNVVAGGGAESVMNLFGNKSNSSDHKTGIADLLRNPIVAMMVGHFVSKLMSKHKMGNAQANNVASSLIPGVISSLINKSNSGDSNGFSLEGLLNSITGGQATSGGGLGQILGQLTGGGGDQQQSGGGGLMDMITKMAGGAQQQQQQNGGGGLMDLIKGFIK